MSYAFDESDGRLFAALNPRIADAVLGRRPHTFIDMSEVRKLETDPARLIHQRLCGWIDPGKLGRAELDTICGYVWPNPSTNGSTIRTRQRVTRQALAELSKLGWKLEEYAKGKWSVCRPRVRSKPVL
jgi:hypothetical protein